MNFYKHPPNDFDANPLENGGPREFNLTIKVGPGKVSQFNALASKAWHVQIGFGTRSLSWQA